MIIASDEDPETVRVKAEFEKHRTDFFSAIGQCITRYQYVEDYLPKVFIAALGGNAEKAAAIFVNVRGLEPKLKIILASLTGVDESIMFRWRLLSERVVSASKARNQIAHARTVQNFGLAKVPPCEHGKIGSIIRFPDPQMELQILGKKNPCVWTLERLIKETNINNKLYFNLVAFSMTLRGEEPFPHLLEE